MLYQIVDGTVTAGGRQILSHVNFEIYGKEKIAVVGSNGAGKTTLLRLLAGELVLDTDDRRMGPGIVSARKVTVGMLHQKVFADTSLTVEEELLNGCPCPDTTDRERYFYEKEYDTLFTGLGFAKEDKKKKLSEFSGGEQTRIGLIALLLQKPDILLLDEPTNHLDIPTVEWLETYLKRYDRAVVMVSHDRFFLDEVAEVVYELEQGKLVRYPGNYTHYRKQKQKNLEQQQKAYEQYRKEKERLEELIVRFKNKPKKAAFARAKKKTLERLTPVEKPAGDGPGLLPEPLEPLLPGSRRVLETKDLKIGHDQVLLELSFRLRKGQKIGIIGNNGSGKTTFLKTIAGLMEPLGGTYTWGNHTAIGYFDQHSAEIMAETSVVEHFHGLFPSLTEKEARGILAAYLFPGKDAGKRVCDLSGGEKARLVLLELLQSRPNVLLLDEPTNHMDVRAKERLEEAFLAYKGSMLFISHDRYFLAEVADAVLIFDGAEALYYPFGYRHYLEHCVRCASGEELQAVLRAEEQALLEGMRAVPKAERHRLREIGEQEARFDWQLRLARERMAEAAARLEKALAAGEQRRLEWEESADFWAVVPGIEEADAGCREEMACEIAEAEKAQAWEAWQEACLAWYETWNEGV